MLQLSVLIVTSAQWTITSHCNT